MTDDVNEAEEMRIQTLASDCVAEIGILNEAGSVAMRGECGKRLRWKYRARTMQRSLTDAAQQLICNRRLPLVKGIEKDDAKTVRAMRVVQRRHSSVGRAGHL